MSKVCTLDNNSYASADGDRSCIDLALKVNVDVIFTEPIEGQKPGTSGLRKKTREFMQQHYIENFTQSVLKSCDKQIKSVIIGGDGRFLVKDAVLRIGNVCAANGIQRIYIPVRNGLMSTPSASAVVRRMKLDGAFLLTASHNPGGEDGDFGIKFNNDLGAPASSTFTDKVYENSKQIKFYKVYNEKTSYSTQKFNILEIVNPLDDKTNHLYRQLSIEYVSIDPVEEYFKMCKELFDFDAIRTLFKPSEASSPLKLYADSMHAVMVPYVERLLIQELGMPAKCHLHAENKEDFGGLHPDPNLVHCSELLRKLREDSMDMAVAFDGDGDRHMVLGRNGFYVSPSDSLAVIVANSKYLRIGQLKGVARSMPTAPAVDRYAKKHNLDVYETPTGWKYFCNLFEDNRISICGEESFGIGADHIREKDGMWAVLAWLSIMAVRKMHVKELCQEYWKEFGRDYYSRYDYEAVSSEKAGKVTQHLDELVSSQSIVGKSFGDTTLGVVQTTDKFEYVDPVDKSVAKNQGYRIIFSNGARIVVRLSGTGSTGETIRVYFNDYSSSDVNKEPSQFMQQLIQVGLEILKINELTLLNAPTVII